MALIDKIKAIADAIRGRTGETGSMTLDEMAETIESMSVGGEQVNTYILVDENGVEVPAVLVDEEVTLTATTNDIRIGTTAVTEEGVVTGEKEIPAYHTSEGFSVISAGQPVCILVAKNCEYTKLQGLICAYGSSITNSVATNKICVNDRVYPVNSTEVLSDVTVDTDTKTIDFGVINDSGEIQILRYIMYKEIY